LRDAGPADPSAPPPITFIATSLGRGRRTKFIEVVVEDRNGNRCATSQGTMIVGGSAALWSGYRIMSIIHRIRKPMRDSHFAVTTQPLDVRDADLVGAALTSSVLDRANLSRTLSVLAASGRPLA
jgi:hypothetical protein